MVGNVVSILDVVRELYWVLYGGGFDLYCLSDT